MVKVNFLYGAPYEKLSSCSYSNMFIFEHMRSDQHVHPCSPVDILANIVNTDEMGHNGQSHQDLHCLPFYA